MSTRTLGAKAEQIAKEYLLNKGYSFIDQNFYASKSGEIDLIMQKDDYIVFFEVKSLKASSPYSIYETVTKSKAKKLKNSIYSWLNRHNMHNTIWRIDFIGIIDNKDSHEIEHIEFLDIL